MSCGKDCDFAESLCFGQEKEARCHQSIIDNHQWVQNVSGEAHPQPCMFTDVMRLCPDGVVDMSDSASGEMLLSSKFLLKFELAWQRCSNYT